MRRALALEAGLAEAELVIWRSARGRPLLWPRACELARGGAQLDFNLSRAGGYSLLGIVRRHRIGVDVERLEDRDERAITTIVRTFAAPERDWVEEAAHGPARDRRALRVWTLKEAYSKAQGLGLGLPFDAFVFTLDDERGVRAFTPPADDTARPWRFAELEPVPGVLVAVAVAVPADDAQDPVLHLGAGFPWSRSELRSFPLPGPVGGRPAAVAVLTPPPAWGQGISSGLRRPLEPPRLP